MFSFGSKNLSKYIWRYSSTNVRNKATIAEASKPNPTIQEKIAGMSPQELIKNTVNVSDWNKTLLVYAGRYKTKAEIPDILPFETVDRARNMVRIKVCNLMIVATLLGAIAMVITGKKAAKEGQSVTQMNLDWHQEYNEKARLAKEALKK